MNFYKINKKKSLSAFLIKTKVNGYCAYETTPVLISNIIILMLSRKKKLKTK